MPKCVQLLNLASLDNVHVCAKTAGGFVVCLHHLHLISASATCFSRYLGC